ncbi:hypothetical protein Bra3105_06640 [Brachybacterium halotolerans subsp. kimchii]|uniref:hypothetical protein n=1 Tax=Brachybacterium halotolerans TaxID=2795215 RepID=UPI001E62E7E2|nr:hypothetical protein [Brachybacterium halotolerans]UEJ83984.1 hypothetical protein Bra3105_06640 [Brachybacterium halotolerans subsp. kimchii]
MAQDHITIDIPEALWLSSNMRPHWAEKARKTAALRQLARLRARTLRTFQVAHCTAFIAYSRAGRADPANAAPTVKALIDGVVDAHRLPDDDHKHLIGPDYRRDPNTGVKGLHRVRLVFTDQQIDF